MDDVIDGDNKDYFKHKKRRNNKLEMIKQTIQ